MTVGVSAMAMPASLKASILAWAVPLPPLTMAPASASFGFWGGNKDVSASLNLTLRDKEGAAQICGVAITGNPPGNTIVTAASSSLSIAANGMATLKLTLAAGKSSQTGSGDRSGDVVLTCGSMTLLVPWWVRIDREAKP